MTARKTKRRGFALTELLILLVSVTVVVWALGQASIHMIHGQRMVANCANRAAMMRSIEDHLRRDSGNARSYTWDGCVLSLTCLTPDGPSAIEYEITDTRITRHVDTTVRDTWEVRRLTFSARTSHGRSADLFWIEFTETPSAGARHLSSRTHPRSFLLPSAVTEGDA